MDFRFLGLALQGARSNFGTLGSPYKLNFAITMNCQSRCTMCNIWQLKPKGELTIEEIREFASKNRSFRWLAITGGEPFLRSDIAEIARAFNDSSKGLYMITIATNSLCNHDVVVKRMGEILALRVPKVVVTLSLDGNRETHDMVRGVPGNYDRVIALYRALKELSKTYRNLSVVLGYTISAANQGHLQETFESVKKDLPGITYNDFHINVAQLSNNYYHNVGGGVIPDGSAVCKDLEAVQAGRRRGFGLMQITEGRFLDGLMAFVKTGRPPLRCRSLDASLFLDSTGNIYPSIMWDAPVVNIRDMGYDLTKVWRGEKAAGMRRLIREGRDPVHWTSCEAYQSIIGSMLHAPRRNPRSGPAVSAAYGQRPSEVSDRGK